MLRLKDREIEIIKKKTKEIIGDSEIIIFGSRTDPNKKGGDIDIYIKPKGKISFSQKLRLKTALEDSLYKPVDILIASNSNREIEKEAEKGVRISD